MSHCMSYKVDITKPPNNGQGLILTYWEGIMRGMMMPVHEAIPIAQKVLSAKLDQLRLP